MGNCLQITDLTLNADKICERINSFFLGMLARSISVEKIVEELKISVLSGKVRDLEGLTAFLKDKIFNNEFVQTSLELINIALDHAEQNFGDKTLPFLSLLFLSDSNIDNFLTAFKAVNLAQHAEDAGEEIYNVVQVGKTGNILGGIVAGINAVKNVVNTVKQAVNPNIIKRNELKNLCVYYVNFITLLPVNILEKYQEGNCKILSYATKVLNTAFSKDVQSSFVEETLFSKYKETETVDIEEFFNDNYNVLKDDKAFRIGLVNKYISRLDVFQIQKILFDGGSCLG